MAIVNELVTRFDYQGSAQPLNNWNSSLSKAISQLAIFATALQGVVFFTGSFVKEASESVKPLSQLSDKIGLSIELIQELEFVSRNFGIEFESLSDRLVTFSEKIGEAFLFKEGTAVEAFKTLNIEIIDSNGNLRKTDDLLFSVINKFERLNLTKQEKIFLAEELGLTILSKLLRTQIVPHYLSLLLFQVLLPLFLVYQLLKWYHQAKVSILQ